MGHILNPIIKRLNITKFWTINWVSYTDKNYYYLVNNDLLISKLIEAFNFYNYEIKIVNNFFSKKERINAYLQYKKHLKKRRPKIKPLFSCIIEYRFFRLATGENKLYIMYKPPKLRFFNIKPFPAKYVDIQFERDIITLRLVLIKGIKRLKSELHKQLMQNLSIGDHNTISKNLFNNIIKKKFSNYINKIHLIFLLFGQMHEEFSIFQGKLQLFFLFQYYLIMNYNLKLLTKRIFRDNKQIFQFYFFLHPYIHFARARRFRLAVPIKAYTYYVRRRLIMGFDLFATLRPVLQHINYLHKKYKLLGFRVELKGRFARSRRKGRRLYKKGRVPHNFYAATMDYTECVCITKFGVAMLKIWIFSYRHWRKNILKKGITDTYLPLNLGYNLNSD